MTDFFDEIEFEGLELTSPNPVAVHTSGRHLFERMKSERQLESLLPWKFRPGDCYHFLSGGDVDSFSFLKWIARQQKIKKLVVSTWCMALQDIDEFERLHALGRIRKIDFYVGEIFPGSYAAEYERLKTMVEKMKTRVCVFRNHSKVFAGKGEEYDFVIESSANIHTNPRTENTVITIDKRLCREYFRFFGGIITFDAEQRRIQKRESQRNQAIPTDPDSE